MVLAEELEQRETGEVGAAAPHPQQYPDDRRRDGHSGRLRRDCPPDPAGFGVSIITGTVTVFPAVPNTVRFWGRNTRPPTSSVTVAGALGVSLTASTARYWNVSIPLNPGAGE